MIELAGWDLRAELAGLWQICFHEPKRYPNYFLNNYFRPQDCLVYRMEGRVAAALYLLPARIAPDGTQAHYVFAAGTLPEFRSRGFMASLLAYAALYGARRGDKFSVVLPANQPLYSFYEQNGYFDYYKIQSVSIERERLVQLASPCSSCRVIACASELNRLRNSCLCRRKGSVLWSDKRFHFTMGFGSTYGDELVCSGPMDHHSYAVCRKANDTVCSVREVMTAPGGFSGLAAAVLKRFPAKTYEFRLPPGQGLFPGEGTEERCGMIRPIGGALWEPAVVLPPYLGLGLD
ncbi:MAG: GNAT family N-acetyltransferase [Oscillospiraceae bacterium]|nr:GNAT family N-acetyltransferase [Oscillospiraceae bacterium]